MNITFGLSDYGKMNFMMQMADLFHEKKKLEKTIKLQPSQQASLSKKIEEINLKGQQIMRQMELYVRKNRSKAVVAFAQFQSMSGRDKIIKALKLNWFQKNFQAKKFRHLRFKNRWLEVTLAPEPDVIIWQN